MKHSPPSTAPTGPPSRHAQKMANWVDAGPGSRFVAATPSSNSRADSHARSSTHSFRSERDVHRRSAEASAADPAPLAPDRDQADAGDRGVAHPAGGVPPYGSPHRSWYTTSSIGPRRTRLKPRSGYPIGTIAERGDVFGQPEDRVDLGGVHRVARGERRTQAERSGGEQDVLDRRIQRRAGRRVRTSAVIDARDDPHRCLVEVLGEMLHALVLARVLRAGHARWWRRGRVHLRHRFERPRVVLLHVGLDRGLGDHDEAPRLTVAPVGRGDGRFEDLPDQLGWHRIRLEPPHRPSRVHHLEDAEFLIAHRADDSGAPRSAALHHGSLTTGRGIPGP